MMITDAVEEIHFGRGRCRRNVEGYSAAVVAQQQTEASVAPRLADCAADAAGTRLIHVWGCTDEGFIAPPLQFCSRQPLHQVPRSRQTGKLTAEVNALATSASSSVYKRAECPWGGNGTDE